MSALTIDELFVADEPSAWEALGFRLQGDSCQLGSVSVRLGGAVAGRGMLGWSLRQAQSTELDGLATSVSESPVRAPAPEHPNGVVGIDHIVAMSPSFERSVTALQAAGLELRRIRDEPTPAGAPRQAFFRLGAEILELVQEPPQIVARAGGPERPTRFWGLALLAAELDRTVAALGGLASPARAAVQPGRRIATVRRAAGLAVPLALMGPDERGESER